MRKTLTEYAVERMKECSKVTIYGPSDLSKKLGIIPFGVEGLSSHDVALFFDNYGIMMRSGFHCAQPLHADSSNCNLQRGQASTSTIQKKKLTASLKF